MVRQRIVRSSRYSDARRMPRSWAACGHTTLWTRLIGALSRLIGIAQPGTAPNGDIFVADGHGHGLFEGHQTNDRIVKLSEDGTFIATWGKHGSAPGEFDVPHGLAMDSTGRLYIGDRSKSRVQIFDQSGNFIAEWKQFGRPSSVYIDKNDKIYVADSQSDDKTNPGFKKGIRIGSIKDGKVLAFIPLTDAAIGPAEEVAADDQGNVFAGFTAKGKMAVRKFVRN